MRPITYLLCSALIVCGCGYDSRGTLYPSADPSVTLTPSSTDVMTSAGDTLFVSALVKNADQEVANAPTLSWSSSAPSVATVSDTGGTVTVTAVGDGTATITASSESAVGTVTVVVHRKVASITVSIPALVLVYGTTLQATATALDARNHPMDNVTGFTFSSSEPATVTVSPGGVLTPVFQFNENRTASITATLAKDGATSSGSRLIRVGAPVTFDIVALMLSEYEVPTRTPTDGAGVAYFSVEGNRVNYTVTWSGLSGPATAVHIHGPGSEADVAGVLVDLAVTGQTTNYGTAKGSFSAADIHPAAGQPAISVDSLVTLLGSRHAYVDVHTAAYAGGEIRGQGLFK
jgi:CHRD domain/Bacterial Ig-like domain (group 2)